LASLPCPVTLAAVDTLGIIAGNRGLPLLVAEQARAQGVERLVAVAIEGETDKRITELADEVTWVKVGQLGKLVRAFQDTGVRQCVMAGQVAPRNLFDLRPDLRAAKLLWNLKQKNAHSIFSAIADELAAEGIELVEATPWLQPAMPGTDYQAGPIPNDNQLEDIRHAHAIAVEVARLDIGQVVVVKDGAVLAVEGWEGTDACLTRGGELAGVKGGAVAVKVAKPSHDFRFDIPCLGEKTLETCAASRIAVLAFEAGRTLLLDREAVEEAATRHKVTVAAV